MDEAIRNFNQQEQAADRAQACVSFARIMLLSRKARQAKSRVEERRSC
jgi:hypothetical protein